MHMLFLSLVGAHGGRHWSETGRLPTPFKMPTWRWRTDRRPDELRAKEGLIGTCRDSNQDKLLVKMQVKRRITAAAIAGGQILYCRHQTVYVGGPDVFVGPTNSLASDMVAEVDLHDF